MQPIVQPSVVKLHPDLETLRCKGGMFDVEPNPHDLNVGKQCRFIKPRCPAEQGTHTIKCLQKNYRGDICYRVTGGPGDPHNFGRVAYFDEVEILT